MKFSSYSQALSRIYDLYPSAVCYWSCGELKESTEKETAFSSATPILPEKADLVAAAF